jgi:hypothetical protein
MEKTTIAAIGGAVLVGGAVGYTLRPRVERIRARRALEKRLFNESMAGMMKSGAWRDPAEIRREVKEKVKALYYEGEKAEPGVFSRAKDYFLNFLPGGKKEKKDEASQHVSDNGHIVIELEGKEG